MYASRFYSGIIIYFGSCCALVRGIARQIFIERRRGRKRDSEWIGIYHLGSKRYEKANRTTMALFFYSSDRIGISEAGSD